MASPSDYKNGNPGGMINPNHGKPRMQKMKWDDHNDRILLLYGLGKEIVPAEFEKIANAFPEKPTKKAIQERLTKLRGYQMEMIKNIGIADPTARIPPAEDDEDVSMATTPSTSSRQPFMSGGNPAANDDDDDEYYSTTPDAESRRAANALVQLSGDSWDRPSGASLKRKQASTDSIHDTPSAPDTAKPTKKPRTRKTPTQTKTLPTKTLSEDLADDGFIKTEVLLNAYRPYREAKEQREKELREKAKEESKAKKYSQDEMDAAEGLVMLKQ